MADSSDLVDGSGGAENHCGCGDQQYSADDREQKVPPTPAELSRDCFRLRAGTGLITRTSAGSCHCHDCRTRKPGDRPENPHRPQSHHHDNPKRLISNSHTAILPEIMPCDRAFGGSLWPSETSDQRPTRWRRLALCGVFRGPIGHLPSSGPHIHQRRGSPGRADSLLQATGNGCPSVPGQAGGDVLARVSVWTSTSFVWDLLDDVIFEPSGAGDPAAADVSSSR
jgi:hypothetical protein